MKLARWRPVCPDCGYNLRGLSHARRCSECGAPFPDKNPVFRRWAVRRLIWDRAERGSGALAYLKSVVAIVVWPCFTARRLTIPDRWGRAVRWAIIHVVLAALAGMLLSNGLYFAHWWLHQAWPDPFTQHPYYFMEQAAPASRALIWMLQSFLAWTILFCLPVAFGCLLSWLIPGRHRAAKWGGVKWGLYASISMYFVFASWYWFHNRYPPAVLLNVGITVWEAAPALDFPIWLAGVVYGLWWAAGLAANPYERAPRWRSFLFYLWLFECVWLAAILFFFSPVALEELL